MILLTEICTQITKRKKKCVFSLYSYNQHTHTHHTHCISQVHMIFLTTDDDDGKYFKIEWNEKKKRVG